ncbi:MAG TPA: hypothetical protein GX504_06250 [Clostridia bacterium]|nr:hypothetical protein [Clostridia bacterium]
MKFNSVELYIKQGRALQKLLQKTNFHGGHREKILDIERKIQKARQLFR